MGKARIHRKNNTPRQRAKREQRKQLQKKAGAMEMLHRELQLSGRDTKQHGKTHHQKTQ